MGQKVNPHGLRVGVIKDWDSRWYAREDKVGDLIVEDYKIREYLKKTLYSAGVPTIEIERDSAKVRIYIHCSRPGVVIVEDRVAHKTYKKIIGRTYRLKAHDENNECGVGDIVRVMETRPLSKDKRWRVVEIVEKAK